MDEGARSMEEVAGRVVKHLYESLADGPEGTRACALVRFYKTHPFGALDAELQEFALRMLGGAPPSPDMRCLVLLATAGEKAEWNSRRSSKGHRAIPLPSEETIAQAPMISSLVSQLGLDAGAVVKPDPKLLLDMAVRTYNVFYVPEALGSPFIPAQEDFAVPFRIRSVLGFGGLLPSGDMFAVIMFLKAKVSPEAAALFKPLALNVKLAVLPFDQAVFSRK